MKIEEITLCCNKSLKARLDEFKGKKCVTEFRFFGMVWLEKEVLETALALWNRLVGETDAIFILRQLKEKHLAKNKKLYFTFVYLEKAGMRDLQFFN